MTPLLEAASLSNAEQDIVAAWLIDRMCPLRSDLRGAVHSEIAAGEIAVEAVTQDQTGHIQSDRARRAYEEQFAIGRRQGLLASLAAVLDVKFGITGLILLPRIERIVDPDRLEMILDFLKTAPTPMSVRAAFPEVDYPKHKQV